MKHRTAGLAILAAILAGQGCIVSHRPTRRDLTSDVPQRQVEAIALVVRRGDRSAVPVLIDLLQSEDGGVRFAAAGGLHRLTGQDFGFHRARTDEERAERIARWRTWWNQQNGEDAEGG